MAGTLGYSSARTRTGNRGPAAPANGDPDIAIIPTGEHAVITTTITPAATPAPRRRRPAHPSYRGAAAAVIPYMPGLDGLRALAVMSVLLYHGDVASWKGGFLGVEVFFVISGYLITSLLLAERRNTRHIDLGAFYARRARRLLPALGLVLFLSMLITVVFLPDEVATLRGDVLSSMTYVTNWFFIVAQKSYFEAVGRPSLVQHLWSLAVEEQFYLLWPLIFAFGMRWLGRRRMFIAVLLGIAASTLLMVALYHPGQDPSRVYYGTDTRAAGLLVGAALAFMWAPYRLSRHVGRFAPLLLNVLGSVALAVLVMQLLVTDQFSDSLYHGGFLRVSVVTAVVIAVAVHPAAYVGKVLGMRPIRWIGLRSYGIYLYHWPIYQLTRPQLDIGLTGWPLLGLRLALTFTVATLSYRYVEQPIRHGALGRAWHTIRHAADQPTRLARTRLVGGALALTCTVAIVAVVAARAEPAATPDYLLAGSTTDGLPPGPGVLPPAPTPTTAKATTETTRRTAGTSTTVVAAGPDAAGQDPTVTPAVDPAASGAGVPDGAATSTVPAAAKRVTAIGDSVMLGAAGTMSSVVQGTVFVDARVGRQLDEGLGILHVWHDQGLLGDVVVVHLGNNGTFSAEEFEELRQILVDVPRVIFLTVKVPRAWEEPNNDVIRAGAASMPNAVLIDWKAQSEERPELFWNDGMHLRPEGAEYYSELINAQLG